MFRIGIDVGGTFTDLVSVDAQGHVTIAKVPSTPADQSLGVMEGLDRLAEALGIDRALREHDLDRLNALRKLDIILAVGRDDPAGASWAFAPT